MSQYLRYCPEKKTYVSTFFEGRWRTFTDKYHRLKSNYYSRCSKEKLKELNALECHKFEEDTIDQSVFDIWFHNMGKYKILIPKDDYDEYLDTLEWKILGRQFKKDITKFSNIYFPNQELFKFKLKEIYENYLNKKELNEHLLLIENGCKIIFKNNYSYKNKLIFIKETSNNNLDNLIECVSKQII